ncbi:MAG: dimethylamine monooxygenase subunit DmmA family protein, partial [Thermomicrobiales bacterium]
MPDDAMLARTSCPVWPVQPPRLPSDATSWTLLSLGSSSDASLRQWRDDIRHMGPPPPASIVRIGRDTLDDWLENLPEWLAEEASTRVVGWRVAVAGEEYAVLAVAEAARLAGLLPSELVLHAESHDRRRVYCPICAIVSVADGAGTDAVRCAGCGRLRAILPHLS